MKLGGQQNRPFRIIFLIIVTVIVVWSLYQEKKPHKMAGQLEFRLITGIQGGTFQIIMMETADRIFVLDSVFKQSFENNDAEIITRKEQLQLLSRYADLQYRAGFTVGKNNEKKELRMTRELFNQLSFSNPNTLEIHPKIRDSLMSFSEIP